tara:strand:- start:994 stop:1179 length:186 start_codon:yes stop_codon:yes gene_type:complete
MLRAEAVRQAADHVSRGYSVLAELMDDMEYDDIEGWLGDIELLYNRLGSIRDDLEDLAQDA